MKKVGRIFSQTATFEWPKTTEKSHIMGICKMLLYATFFVLNSSFLVSCSEHDNTEEEFVDWKEKNENYFNNLFTQTQQRIANNDKDWKILTQWSLEDSIATQTYNHIIVHVLEEGNGAGYPIYTDSVRVHYLGRLLPSTSLASGYIFDRSYSGEYNPTTSYPATFKCSSLGIGFATAIMNMRIGDHWQIFVPHQLGYGINGTTDNAGKIVIPGYSTLIFDVTLCAYYRANVTPPPYQSKQFTGWTEE